MIKSELGLIKIYTRTLSMYFNYSFATLSLYSEVNDNIQIVRLYLISLSRRDKLHSGNPEMNTFLMTVLLKLTKAIAIPLTVPFQSSYRSDT